MKKNLSSVVHKPKNRRMAASNTNAAAQGAVDDGKTTFVAKDMIWKAYVNKADIQAKNWNQNWGFLVSDQVVYKYLF